VPQDPMDEKKQCLVPKPKDKMGAGLAASVAA